MLNPAPLSFRKPVPKESPKAAAAFEQYYDLGEDRSLLLLAQKRRQELIAKNQSATKSLPSEASLLANLKKWSVTHHWQERVKDYDAKEVEKKRKKRQAELEKMDDQHAIIGHGLLIRAAETVQHHIDAQDTTLSSAVSLMKAAYELERLARGAATARVEGDVALTVLPKVYVNIDPDEEGSEL